MSRRSKAGAAGRAPQQSRLRRALAAGVEMTFLDPIGFAGAFDWRWGARH